MKIFVAGATGVIGRPLIPQLVDAGHQVVATSRSTAKHEALRRLGAEPVVMDGLDAESVGQAVATAAPDVVINQMTAIGDLSDLKHFDRVFATTNKLRTAGNDHLLAAARAAGVRRVVVQSYAGWPYERTGGPVKTETDPLDPNPPAAQSESLAAIRYLERATLDAPMQTVVLRYGSFYGSGASAEMMELIRTRKFPVVGDGGGIWSCIHVEDAAAATVAAVERGSGVYNIVDDSPTPVRELIPAIAHVLGGKPPRHVPVWLARMMAGDVGVSMLTQIRGSSNAKARTELGWTPRYPSVVDGLRHDLQSAAA